MIREPFQSYKVLQEVLQCNSSAGHLHTLRSVTSAGNPTDAALNKLHLHARNPQPLIFSRQISASGGIKNDFIYMAASSVAHITCWDVKIAADFMLKNT